MNKNDLLLPDIASGPTRRGIIQIHPSLKCNLSCTHCYSSSGPLALTELDAKIICEVISDAATMGYQVVSVSGGEPLMYVGLDEVLTHAKSLGLCTTVTTNGFFASQERMKNLSKLVDVLAISLDGPPEIHNEIRGSMSAFKKLEAGVENVKEAGIPFGFIHTLTQLNWEYLQWIAEFAAEKEACLLQIHPLELAGRAKKHMASDSPEDDTRAKIYILAFLLAGKYINTMKVQLDLLHRDHLREEPELVYAGNLESKTNKTNLAKSLGLLVLEPDGTVVPVAYGFSRHYQVCNVKEQRLAKALPEYLTNGYLSFRDLCNQVWDDLCGADAPLLSNWNELVVSRSHMIGASSDRSNHSSATCGVK